MRTSPYLVGLIGEGIGASLTPLLHEAEAAHLGLDYEYRTIDLLISGDEPHDLARTGRTVKLRSSTATLPPNTWRRFSTSIMHSGYPSISFARFG